MNNAVEIVSKQVLRGEVLQVAANAEPIGAGVELIYAFLKQKGFAVDKNDVVITCRYLEGKGLVVIEKVENAVLMVSRNIAHITPKGIDVLEGTVKVDGVELPG